MKNKSSDFNISGPKIEQKLVVLGTVLQERILITKNIQYMVT